MRIGTWNLEGKWSSEHLDLLQRQECDVWLLTEVQVEAEIPSMTAHRTTAPMGPTKTWAAIFSVVRPDVRSDPHRASAHAYVDGTPFLSSVLPWRSCGSSWAGSTLAEKQTLTLNTLRPVIGKDIVWGGDWNQALEGPEHVGTLGGRDEIIQLTDYAHLSVPTRSLGSPSPGHRSIDHIAVPVDWDVQGAHRVSADLRGQRLSDHDAYVVTLNA